MPPTPCLRLVGCLACVAVMAQRPQISIAIRSALLQRDAVIYLMVAAYQAAALASKSITLEDALSRTHPRSAPDTLSGPGLRLKRRNQVAVERWQCCLESLEFHRVEMQKPRSAWHTGFSVRAEAGQRAGNCTGSNYGVFIANTGYICNGIICSGASMYSITSSSAACPQPSATLSLSRSRTGRTE
jgi:hypothetical protein